MFSDPHIRPVHLLDSACYDVFLPHLFVQFCRFKQLPLAGLAFHFLSLLLALLDQDLVCGVNVDVKLQ